jgi:integrative and conjugative element protein (TIGR02256 family)
VAANGAHGCRIAVSVLRSLDRMCRENGTLEAGGILVGRYVDDAMVAQVTEATPPPTDSQRGPTWFARGVQGLRELLAARWRARERGYYLGEWHFHPADTVVPSAVDFSQMRTIALADEYQCSEPILLIVGHSVGRAGRPMRVFVCPRGQACLEILQTVSRRATRRG